LAAKTANKIDTSAKYYVGCKSILDYPQPLSHSYRGRFAPSPTGELHWGSLFNALAGFLQARSQQGEWLLRIDDLDPARSHQQATDAILFTLDYFGLYWDGAIHYQSQHIDSYQAALSDLQRNNHVYPCCCSRRQLKRYHTEHPKTPDYPGLCRHKNVDTSKQHALRIKTQKNASIGLNDPLQGKQQQILSNTCGDFIVLRSDMITAYHLASVVDDYNLGITQALRGYDLLQSSIQQHYLQHLLEYPVPQYIHLPVIVDDSGTKLSKQTGATPVSHSQPTETLYTLLLQLNQNPPEDLRHQSQKTLLTWAINNWSINRLIGCTQIQSPKIFQH